MSMVILNKVTTLSCIQSQPTVNWVVPMADRGRYDEIFLKTDTDMDGLVTGGEVIEIFMHSTLPQTTLAQIW